MTPRPEFHANPIGVFVEPQRLADAAAGRAGFTDGHRRATAGGFAPEAPVVEIPAGG